MAPKPIPQEIVDSVIADWRTGAYSLAKLATIHKISKASAGNICKGIPQDTSAIVDAGAQYKQSLAAHDGRTVQAVQHVVDERTKHILFFDNATVDNISKMVKKIGDNTTIVEHRIAQSAIKDGRETVLGKQPDTAIQINNNIDHKPMGLSEFYGSNPKPDS